MWRGRRECLQTQSDFQTDSVDNFDIAQAIALYV